jgi:hypothetical protein
VIVRAGARDYLGMLVLHRPLCLALALFPSLLVMVWGAPSWAAAPVRLVYQAPAECPSREQFERAVSERDARFDQAPASVAGAELHVAVRADTEGFVGTLELAGLSPVPQAREVHAEGCEEAVRGLAVITALVLRAEPSAASSAVNEAAATAVPPKPLPSMPLPSMPLPPKPLPSTRLKSIGQFEDEGVDVEAGTVRFERALTHTLSAGVEVGLIPGVVMPRYDLTLSRANVVALPGGDRYLVGGWLPRVRWTVLGGSSYRSGDASVDMLGLKAAFDGCSSVVYDPAGLVMLICGQIGAGAMRMVTRDAAGASSRERIVGIGGGGLELNAQYDLGSVFHLDARIGGDLTFPGIVAERADGSEIFSASLWSAHASIGLGLHF